MSLITSDISEALEIQQEFLPKATKPQRDDDRIWGYFPTTPAVGSSRMGVKIAVRWPVVGS